MPLLTETSDTMRCGAISSPSLNVENCLLYAEQKRGGRDVAPAPLFRRSVVLSYQRKELLAYNLAVFDGVHANLRQLHSLLRILVRHVDIVLNHESIMRHERSANFRAVRLHV